MKDKVSNAVVSRLPLYYRYLSVLEKSGYTRISSQQLGEKMGLTASQIRQDINCFGGFGQQGYGYNIAQLKQRVGEILGITSTYHIAIVGAGNIGRAISNYSAFDRMGFQVDALFDIDTNLVGGTGKPVYPIDELEHYLIEHSIDVGVIAVPDTAAQAACDALVKGGVKAIWNFAPVNLVVPKNVVVRSVHLLDALLVLSFYMTNRVGEDGEVELPDDSI